MLEFSEKGKIALADGLIKYINRQKGYTGISDRVEDGVREVHIDYEGLDRETLSRPSRL